MKKENMDYVGAHGHPPGFDVRNPGMRLEDEYGRGVVTTPLRVDRYSWLRLEKSNQPAEVLRQRFKTRLEET
jgi:hypothetical protein